MYGDGGYGRRNALARAERESGFQGGAWWPRCVTRLPPPLKNNSATPVLHCTASVTSEENTLPKVQTSHRRSIVWRTPPGTQRFLAHHCSPPRDPLILPWQLTSTRCLGRSSLPRSPPALQSLVSPSGKTVARAHAAVPSFASTKVSGGQLAKQQPFHRHHLRRLVMASRFLEPAPAASAAARETALSRVRGTVSAVGPALCQTRMSGSAQSLGLALPCSGLTVLICSGLTVSGGICAKRKKKGRGEVAAGGSTLVPFLPFLCPSCPSCRTARTRSAGRCRAPSAAGGRPGLVPFLPPGIKI